MTVGRLGLSALGLFVAACASPVSAVRVDPQTVYHELSRSAVASSEPSWPTRNVLQERGLVEAFQTRPEVAIADLHRAHIEPIQSELVVRSPHSAQGNPHTIEEVRRILRLHAGLD